VLLKLRRLSKSFLSVQVLDRVGLQLHAGKVHAVVGENGAGKTTLMKIASSVYQPS
jgi:ABC-type sugar transport system ATPase subunit